MAAKQLLFDENARQTLLKGVSKLARAVAAKLGVTAEFVETPWDAIFAGLTAKRFDVIANQVTRNSEREGLSGLSSTSTVSEGVIATRADDASSTGLAPGTKTVELTPSKRRWWIAARSCSTTTTLRCTENPP